MSGCRVSSHAIDRWRERVRPEATRAQAIGDLMRIVSQGRLSPRPPRWLGRRHQRGRGSYVTWREQYPDLALVIVEGVITTVLIRETADNWRKVDRMIRAGWERKRPRLRDS